MEQGRVRFWQGFSLALALTLLAAIGGSAYTAFAQSTQKPRFAEIDAERINVIEADGTVKLGKTRQREATLMLADGAGRPRLRLIVPADGTARIQFLDEQGLPTATLPDAAASR